MKARIQLTLAKFSDPRTVRVLLFGLALTLVLMGCAPSGCPGGDSGSCGGG